MYCARGERKENDGSFAWVEQKQSALPKIVQHQSGQYDHQPRKANRKTTEMTHVGVERLATGYGEHDRTKRNERRPWLPNKKVESPIGVEGEKNLRCLENGTRAEPGNGCKPDDHYRAKSPADLCCSS